MNWEYTTEEAGWLWYYYCAAYPFSAQNTGQITLELRNKPLPAVLKLD